MAVRTPHGIRPKERFKSCISRIRAAISSAPFKTDAEPAAREPLPPDVKRSLIAMAALAVFAILFSITMSRANSSDKAISTFIDSIAAQDVKSFSSVVVSGREDFELTEESAAAFLALYHDQSAVLEEYRETLNSDLALLKQGEPSLGNGIVRLVKLDRVLHKAYRVELSGADVFFSSNLDNTQVDVGGKTLLLEQARMEYALPLLPGRYNIHAVHSNTALGQSFSTTLTDCALTDSSHVQHLELECSTVILGDIGRNVASLTVNGVEYGPVTFNDLGEFAITPLPKDVEITVTYDADGIELRDHFAHSGSYCSEYFYPSPTVASESAQDMLDQVGASVREMLDAYRTTDFSALEAMPSYGSSTVLKTFHDELAASLNTDSHLRYVYHYTLREMQGDLHWEQDYSYDALTFRTMIFLGLDYTYERYYNTELQTNLIDEVPSVYQKDCLLAACVQRINGQWVLSDLDWTYFNDCDIGAPYVM